MFEILPEWHPFIVMLVLVGCFCCLLLTRYPTDLILGASVVLLLVLGVLTPAEAVSGLSNTGTIVVAILFVVAAGLYRSGVVSWISRVVLGTPASLRAAQLKLMLPVSVLSSVMNNTPVVAMLVPAVTQWAKQLKLPVSQLMMPLSFAAIVGGLCTTIGTSTNLVITSMLADTTHGGTLAVLELAWVGIPCVFITVIYVSLVSRRLLPMKSVCQERFSDTRRYTIEMMVGDRSPLVGKSIEKAGLRQLPNVYLAEIFRRGCAIAAVSPNEELMPGDRLVFVGDIEHVVDLKNIRGLQVASNQIFKLDAPQTQRCLVEVIVSPHFPDLNKTVRAGRFRNKYGAVIIAIARNGEELKQKIGDIVLKPGDTLLLESTEIFEEQQRYTKDFMLVSAVTNSKPVRHEKVVLAGGILLSFIVAVGVFSVDLLTVSAVAAVALVATRCLSAADARKSLDVSVVIVIADSIALGLALEKTGVAHFFASYLVQLVGDSAYGTLAVFFVLTAAFSAIVSNLATAVMLFPVAVETSSQLGVSLMPFAVMLMVGASASFSTPIGYQTNLMVYGPGNYHFRDFVKMGMPLTLLIGVVALLVVPIVWEF